MSERRLYLVRWVFEQRGGMVSVTAGDEAEARRRALQLLWCDPQMRCDIGRVRIEKVTATGLEAVQ